MKKEEKLDIINDIIRRANLITYTFSAIMTRCEDEAKTFVRNVLPDSSWIEEIDKIRWSPVTWTTNMPDGLPERAWNEGKTKFIRILNSIRNEIALYATDTDNSKPAINSDRVFVVHGHNDTMKLAVTNMIAKLGLSPIILHEQPNQGRTIIEKFEELSQNTGFAIVLLSADDKTADSTYRARQNVVFELGYFIAKLGRENVVALYDTSSGEIELPSDISGVLYRPYDKPDGAWRYEVVQELKAAGFAVDANALL